MNCLGVGRCNGGAALALAGCGTGFASIAGEKFVNGRPKMAYGRTIVEIRVAQVNKIDVWLSLQIDLPVQLMPMCQDF